MAIISQFNPYEKVDGGAWQWNPSLGQAQFNPDPVTQAATGVTSSPSTTQSSNVSNSVSFGTGGNSAGTIGLNSITTSSGTPLAARPMPPGAPPAPNYANLQSLQNQVQRQTAITQAMSDYDKLYASTQASGFQSANNAGTSYSNRLMQAGINPTSSGVVAAQAKLPIYNQLANITTQKDTTRLDAINKADALAAQIASTIANIQLGYSKTLADFNSQQSQYELDLNKFNASQLQNANQFGANYSLQTRQLQDQERQQQRNNSIQDAATLAASGRSGTAPFTPGYIPDQGSLIPSTGLTGSMGHDVAVGWGYTGSNQRGSGLQYY